MSLKKVAIIGAGTISQKIAEELDQHLSHAYQLIGMMKNTDKNITELRKRFNIPIVTDFNEIIRLKPDFIIEAASVDVVKTYGKEILKRGIHFIPLSVGGLVNHKFYEELQILAKENNTVLYIPSGAIGGFDLMRKLTLADSPVVTVNTYKSPESLKGVKLVNNKELALDRKEVIFDGSAEEAIKHFPQNINIAIATALATVGPDKVQTTIHSDPEIKANLHKIMIKNKEGKADISFAAQPSDNARTSSITAWSVISLLQNISDPIRFF